MVLLHIWRFLDNRHEVKTEKVNENEKVILAGIAIFGTLIYLDQHEWNHALDDSDTIPPFVSASDYIKLYYPLAQKYTANGLIDPVFSIAQSGIETAWGRSDAFCKGKNAFGIIADKSWKGKTIQPNASGRIYRAYNSVEESFADHAKVLQEPQYAPALDPLNSPDLITEAQNIVRVYDPGNANYPTLIAQTIKLVQSKILA